jgi:hypothetical protein
MSTLEGEEEGMGKIACWIPEVMSPWGEGTFEGAMIDGYWVGRPNIITWVELLWKKKDIPPAQYTLTCQLLDETSSGGKQFRITGITVA